MLSCLQLSRCVRIRPQLKRYITNLTAYDPHETEKAWYEEWEKAGLFRPQLTKQGLVKPAGVFSIPAPPPNVTGALHLGHALTISLQDALIRYNRMRGKTVLFLPGFDHAGIATQSVVERHVWKNEGKLRQDFGRELFVQKIWDWKEIYHKRIKEQVKRLGGSYDWSREAFTLDSKLSNAVKEAFVRLHDEGIIYRDSKLVNWVVKLNTAISNLEVVNKEIKGRTLVKVPGYDKPVEFGVLTSLAYPVDDSSNPGENVIVSTTRPETIFGDTAIAVHSKDDRYKHLHGKFVEHPLLPEKRLPIIVDDEIVDMEFGTGAVKITPAHDVNDYKVGKRHNLEFINIFTDDGKLNANCGKSWEGMRIFDARTKVVEELKRMGLFVSEQEHSMTIPICSRSGDIIQPMMKPQWWIAQKDMAAEAIKAVQSGKIKIIPKHSEEEYFRWMNNIQDWCISRQLWWGHRCPVYFINIKGQDCDRSDNRYWVAGRDIEEATIKAKKRFPGSIFTLEQDEDVLDTWFSSALWPFSTLGWPEKTKDMDLFYPFSMLETGWDILFFWVSRMILLGLKLTGEVPFREVFCHPLIRDSQGRKMSKSLGNVIDPIDIIQGTTLEKLQQKLLDGNLDKNEVERALKVQREMFPNGIPQCGADALRFALCSYTGNENAHEDINLDVNKIQTYRKFCNKIYQAVKFSLLKWERLEHENCSSSGVESLADQWITFRMNETAKNMNAAYSKRDFLEVTITIYRFWYDICDTYIEYVKFITNTQQQNSELAHNSIRKLLEMIDAGLRMVHPMMPYISEDLWRRLPMPIRGTAGETSISIAPFPEFSEITRKRVLEAHRNFEIVLDTIKTCRSLLNQYNIMKGGSIFVKVADPKLHDLLVQQRDYIKNTVRKNIYQVEVVSREDEVPEGCAQVSINPQVQVYLLIRGQIKDVEGDIQRAQKKIGKLRQKRDALAKMMNNENYLSKVTRDVQVSNEEAFKGATAEIESLQLTIKNLQKIM